MCKKEVNVDGVGGQQRGRGVRGQQRGRAGNNNNRRDQRQVQRGEKLMKGGGNKILVTSILMRLRDYVFA